MRKTALVLLLFAGVLVWGAPLPAPFMLGSPVSLPEQGLRFRAFREMKPMPLPMPAFHATRNDGTKLLSNLEYWKFRQTAGIWLNSSCFIRVGAVTFAPLENQTLQSEGELAESLIPIEEEPSEEQEKKWVGDFTDTEVISVNPYPVSLYGASARVFELKANDKVRQSAYMIVSKSQPVRRILLCFAIDADRYDERVETSIRQALSSIQFVAPKVQTASLAERLRTKGTPEYEASRERVLLSIRNFRDWWYEETDNYIFITNDPGRRAMARLRTDLEKAREVFAEYYPLRHPMQAVSVVRIFNTRNQYKEYVGEDLQWSGGLWMPARRELVISPLDKGARESVRQMIMRQVAFHEGFHQYLYFATRETQADMWFNEGTAQFFEGIEFQSGKGIVRLPRQTETMLSALFANGKIHDIDALAKMDRQTFYGAGRDVNYPLAQALLYYLWKGAPVDKKPHYAEIPGRYYDTLVETKDAAKANAAAWEGVNFEELSKDLSRFWNNSNLIRESIRYQPTFPKSPPPSKQ